SATLEQPTTSGVNCPKRATAIVPPYWASRTYADPSTAMAHRCSKKTCDGPPLLFAEPCWCGRNVDMVGIPDGPGRTATGVLGAVQETTGAPLAPGSRAPALKVTSVEAGGTSLDDLTAGGAALLVFVSEECPTSAMALRNLGPLCRGWEQAGLSVTAV